MLPVFKERYERFMEWADDLERRMDSLQVESAPSTQVSELALPPSFVICQKSRTRAARARQPVLRSRSPFSLRPPITLLLPNYPQRLLSGSWKTHYDFCSCRGQNEVTSPNLRAPLGALKRHFSRIAITRGLDFEKWDLFFEESNYADWIKRMKMPSRDSSPTANRWCFSPTTIEWKKGPLSAKIMG